LVFEAGVPHPPCRASRGTSSSASQWSATMLADPSGTNHITRDIIGHAIKVHKVLGSRICG
jgi:hypothetical protein